LQSLNARAIHTRTKASRCLQSLRKTGIRHPKPKRSRFFPFSQDFPQGEKSPDTYEKDLRQFFHKRTLSGNPMSTPFQVMFMVRGLCADYGKLLLDFRDGTKKFKKETMETITSWCKHWDTNNFSKEYQPVQGRRHHKKFQLPPTASAAGTEKQGNDPPGKIHHSPYHHLGEFDIDRINRRWKKIEDIKNCIHCGGHKDGAKYMSCVCLGLFECLVLKQANCKLIKLGGKTYVENPADATATVTVVDLPPEIPDNSDADPSGRCAELVDSSSVEHLNHISGQVPMMTKKILWKKALIILLARRRLALLHSMQPLSCLFL